MNTRNWPIRSKIIALVIVPLAALLALWIFATTLTVGPALNLLAAQTLLDEVGRPGQRLVDELTQERRLSLIHLAGGGDETALHEQRVQTDQAIAELRRRASGDALRNAASDLLIARLDQTFAAIDILPSGRGLIDRREMDRPAALNLYSSIISSTFRTFSEMATLPDEDLSRRVRAVTELGQAREVLGQADALLAGVFTAGRFGEGEHARLVQSIGIQRFLYDSAVTDLTDADRIAFRQITGGEPFARLQAMEQELINRGRPGAAPPIDAEAWYSSYDAVQQQLREFELTASQALAEDSQPVAIGILARLGLAGVLGFGAVVASVVIALRIGQAIIRRLTGLRAAALEMAGKRLPDVVGRLRRGEEVDVAAETPSLEYGNDEVGQVGYAFGEVQRTAVQSAVDEAALRRGLNEVFLNIARRSQALLHRQLSTLDRMERRTTDPEELAELFLVDHMATRMRRHAEDLVVLAGATPGRGWRNPIPMIDVIRGAVSEVEDYARIDIMTVQPAAVTGRAVGDVIHLLAELIENATAFSPPHTRVQIVGQPVPHGYAIEIEDRGLGMTAEAIDEANRRLASPPEFDPANSARLGLFVVARLGARHGVRVRLRTSPYGGLTAVALVPADLVVLAGADPLALPGQPRPGVRGRPSGPAALPPGPDSDSEATQDVRRSPAVLLPSTSPESARRIRTATKLAAASAPPGASAAAPAARPPLPGRVAPQEPDRMARRPAGARPTGSGSPVGGLGVHQAGATDDGLPRRVRQSSLAPQLRAPAATVAFDEPAARSPEQVRAAMSALQAGAERGRREAESALAGGLLARGTATPPAGALLPPPSVDPGASTPDITAPVAPDASVDPPASLDRSVEPPTSVGPAATSPARDAAQAAPTSAPTATDPAGGDRPVTEPAGDDPAGTDRAGTVPSTAQDALPVHNGESTDSGRNA